MSVVELIEAGVEHGGGDGVGLEPIVGWLPQVSTGCLVLAAPKAVEGGDQLMELLPNRVHHCGIDRIVWQGAFDPCQVAADAVGYAHRPVAVTLFDQQHRRLSETNEELGLRPLFAEIVQGERLFSTGPAWTAIGRAGYSSARIWGTPASVQALVCIRPASIVSGHSAVRTA